ncbi:methyltransferase domain-containing protein, partial [Gammaproteobacteria bacterium]|nr:methyltransferase domain-containing protein [Gammaproteobacteria bacterium]
ARKVLDQVFVGDATAILNDGTVTEKYEKIIFADILEHLVDPWTTLRSATDHLSKHGCIITSIPNIRHYSTLIDLVIRGHWPYRDRGIHDRTHLRFFTYRNICDLHEQAGLEIREVKTNYRIVERPHSINKYARFVDLPIIRNFFAFQYLVVSTPK